jgi:hypothetical protein
MFILLTQNCSNERIFHNEWCGDYLLIEWTKEMFEDVRSRLNLKEDVNCFRAINNSLWAERYGTWFLERGVDLFDRYGSDCANCCGHRWTNFAWEVYETEKAALENIRVRKTVTHLSGLTNHCMKVPSVSPYYVVVYKLSKDNGVYPGVSHDDAYVSNSIGIKKRDFETDSSAVHAWMKKTSLL